MKTAIHFSKVKDIQPNGTYTIRARVMSGQGGARDARPRRHLSPAGAGRRRRIAALQVFPRRLSRRAVEARATAHSSRKAEVDKLRPARLEMINPQIRSAEQRRDGFH